VSGIAGIVGKKESDIGKLLKQMLGTIQHRGADGAGIVIGGVAEQKTKFEELRFDGKRGRMALGHIGLALADTGTALQPVHSKDGQISLFHNGEIYNSHLLRSKLSDEYPFGGDSDSELVLRLLQQQYHGDLASAVKEILPKLDGVYTLTVSDKDGYSARQDRAETALFLY
jgi:asparagine synthetase B (glutamine-hydrolysing)